jgi:aquaporin Z
VAKISSNPVSDSDVASDSPSLTKRLVAELFGTFLLVFGVIGTAFFLAPKAGPAAVALAVGIAVLAGAYAVGHISGGHFNPAVTVGAAAAGRFAWKDVLPYVVAQVVGGALATTILLGIKAGAPDKTFAGFGDVSNGFDAHSPSGFNLISVFLAEVVVTAIFLYVILGVTDRRAPTGFAPLAIGLTLTLLHLITIPIDNASLNPARSIATAIYGGPDALVQLPVFLIAPVIGGLIAGLTYAPLFGAKKG